MITNTSLGSVVGGLLVTGAGQQWLSQEEELWRVGDVGVQGGEGCALESGRGGLAWVPGRGLF